MSTHGAALPPPTKVGGFRAGDAVNDSFDISNDFTDNPLIELRFVPMLGSIDTQGILFYDSHHALLAQRLERRPHKPWVAGSNPAGRTKNTEAWPSGLRQRS